MSVYHMTIVFVGLLLCCIDNFVALYSDHCETGLSENWTMNHLGCNHMPRWLVNFSNFYSVHPSKRKELLTKPSKILSSQVRPDLVQPQELQSVWPAESAPDTGRCCCSENFIDLNISSSKEHQGDVCTSPMMAAAQIWSCCLMTLAVTIFCGNLLIWQYVFQHGMYIVHQINKWGW